MGTISTSILFIHLFFIMRQRHNKALNFWRK